MGITCCKTRGMNQWRRQMKRLLCAAVILLGGVLVRPPAVDAQSNGTKYDSMLVTLANALSTSLSQVAVRHANAAPSPSSLVHPYLKYLRTIVNQGPSFVSDPEIQEAATMYSAKQDIVLSTAAPRWQFIAGDTQILAAGFHTDTYVPYLNGQPQGSF